MINIKMIVIAAVMFVSSALYADTSISMMLGDVKIQSQGSTAWQGVKSGQKIKTGDTIQTGAGSFAEINTNENTIRIQPKTKVKFGSTIVGNKPQSTLAVFAGSVNCKMDKLKKNNEKFNVNTASAVCAVRGTEFDVASGADGQTVLQVTEGAVEFEGLNSSVLVAKNQESTVAIGGNPEPVKIIKRKDWEKWADESSSDVKGKEPAIIDGCLAKVRKLDSDIKQLEKERDDAKAEFRKLGEESKTAKASGDSRKASELARAAEVKRVQSVSKNSIAFYQASRIELVKNVADNAFESSEAKDSIKGPYDEICEIYTMRFNAYIKPILDEAQIRQEIRDKKKKKN
ncbi:MAG TPA: FecR family protein [Spirochaetota bacterium]|nr:FecR family protein [Spirochaetota bacterium]